MTKNVSASIRARLLALAKSKNTDFNQILIRYSLERILYRLGISTHANKFILKGALLFNLWYNMPHRATKDVDLLGFGPSDLQSIAETFKEIANIVVEDGINFDSQKIRVEEIRKEANYAGARVLIDAEINNARCKVQIDIGFGDAVTPGPLQTIYPVLLEDIPAPKLQIYPIYTVISEKVHAITLLGMANSRLKDYLDLWILLKNETINNELMAQAIYATFSRRSTSIPEELPLGLTSEFALDSSRQAMWVAFLKKNNISSVSLNDVVMYLSERLVSVLNVAKKLEIQEQESHIS